MIVVKLMGGLGNQMFQYAFGRHLSVKHKTELKLDTSYLSDRSPKRNFSYRELELNAFNIKASLASEQDIKMFEKGMKRKILHHITLYFPFPSINLYLREPHFHFFKRGLSAPVNTYIDGYWQSEKYFRDSGEYVKEDFTPVKPLSDKSNRLKKEIQSNQSVSIHVRRSDYLKPQNIYKYHICSENYYYDAMEIISRKISNPKFYIFSDEPGWFKEHIKTKFSVEYIEHNTGDSDYEDLCLMTYCKHNIIANSSFSWWGAWLSKNVNSIVVAPKNWFTDKQKKTKDLLPQSWIKI
jgi:glycosyl transferase family 11